MPSVETPSWLVAVPPAVLTLVVSLIGIGSYGLGNDEYATWHASTLSFPDLFRLLDHQDTLLGPSYLTMHAWIELAGDGAGHMRAPSAAAMACAAALVALIGRRLFDPLTGLGAGLVFAVIPSTSSYGQEARPYAFAVAGVLLATLLLLRAIDVPSWRRWAWYGAALLVVGLSHVVALTVLLAHAVLVWRDARTGPDGLLRRWLVGTAVPVLILLPLVAKGATQTANIAWIKADAHAVQNFPERLFGSSTVALIVIVLALMAGTVMAGKERRPAVLLLTWAVLPTVFCYLTFPLLHVFLYRYLLFTVPAWALLAAALPREIGLHADRRRSWSFAAVLVVIVVAVAGLPSQRDVRREEPKEPNFEAAARVVQADLQRGDGIVFAETRRNGRRAFAYLHATGVVGAPKDVLLGRPASELGRFDATECRDTAQCLAGTDRIWLLTDSKPGLDRVNGLSSRAQRMLTSQFDRRHVRTVRHIRIFLLERDSPSA